MNRLTIIAAVGVVLLAAAARADDTTAGAPAAVAPAPAATGTPAPILDTTPVAPAGPKLSNFADLVFDGIVGENAPEVTADFATGIAIGSTPLSFEKTKLGDISAVYGGETHSQGDAGNGVTWLCYTQHAATKADTPKTVWFTSTNEMADAGNTLSMVVVENVDAAKVSGCTTAPKAFSFPSFSVPTLGASLADLKTRFGVLVQDKQKNVYYNSTRALNDGTGQSVYQTLGYRMTKKGIVNGIAVSQVTTD